MTYYTISQSEYETIVVHFKLLVSGQKFISTFNNQHTRQLKAKLVLAIFNSIHNICAEKLHKNLLTTKSSDRLYQKH